ncbi:MAG: DUF982 domain-containing protein [Rhizobiaceae bacterium]|jgi:hypothetical protein
MLQASFRRPVVILAGLGHARQITSAAEALAFLEQYPARLRDEAYYATHEACRDGLTGAAAAEEAYDVFSAFAHRSGILLDEPVDGLSPQGDEFRHAA